MKISKNDRSSTHNSTVFLKYTQNRTEKILSNINQQNHGTTLTNITNRSATANQGRCEKTNF